MIKITTKEHLQTTVNRISFTEPQEHHGPDNFMGAGPIEVFSSSIQLNCSLVLEPEPTSKASLNFFN